MRKIMLVALAALMLLAVPVFAQDEPTIADIVVSAASGETPEFSTLLAAILAADPAVLEAASNPEAELTVFAPTDAAFAALVEALGEEAFGEVLADQAALTDILLFHIVPGKVMSSDVVALLGESSPVQVRTLQGQYIDIATGDMGDILVNGAKLNLDMVDIEASNGVIHVIDAVILPESRTIAEIVVEFASGETPEFSTLLTAVLAADPAVLEAISDPEAELTVFAPTDAAFAALAEALGEEAFGAVLADQAALSGILLYHVVAGNVGSTDLAAALAEAEALEVTTVNGATATIAVMDGSVMINDANIIITNVDAANGIIHVIDAVILPPG